MIRHCLRAVPWAMSIQNSISMLVDAFKCIRFIALGTQLLSSVQSHSQRNSVWDAFIMDFIAGIWWSHFTCQRQSLLLVRCFSGSFVVYWLQACVQTEYEMRTTKTFHRMAHVFGVRFNVQSAIINIWWMADCKKSILLRTYLFVRNHKKEWY